MSVKGSWPELAIDPVGERDSLKPREYLERFVAQGARVPKLQDEAPRDETITRTYTVAKPNGGNMRVRLTFFPTV